MSILILAAALAALPGASMAQENCKAPRPTTATSPGLHIGAPARAQRLGRMPDADLVRTVLRNVGGCDYIEVVRSNVSTGGAAHRQPVWKLTPPPEPTRAELPRR